MKSRFLILAAVLLCTLTQAAAQNDDIRLLFERELKEKAGGIRSIECSFVQTRSMAVLAEDVDKSGRYSFLQPYNILLAFDDGDYIKMTQTMFAMKQNGHASTMKVSSNPMLKSLSRMLSACISGDVSQITAGFTAEIECSDGEYVMRLAPQKGKAVAKVSLITLVFDRKDMSLKNMKMQETSGDYTQYRFFDTKYDVDVDASLFEIK